jgi:hypothetical protein
MTSFLESNARAALCRQLAKLEPDSKNLWLAEADRWSHLSQKSSVATMAGHGEPAGTWCWAVMPRYKHRDAKTAEVRFELQSAAKPADEGAFEELLRYMSLWTREPNSRLDARRDTIDPE